MHSVIERYEGALVRYAQQITGDAERARDAAQEAFLKLWACRPGARPENPGAWLFAVCRNACLDILRKESKMTLWNEAQQQSAPADTADPHGAAEQAEAIALAQRELLDLPASQREVIRLKLQEGFSYRQIAEITGKSVTNVGFLIHRGISTIRDRLQRAGALGR